MLFIKFVSRPLWTNRHAFGHPSNARILFATKSTYSELKDLKVPPCRNASTMVCAPNSVAKRLWLNPRYNHGLAGVKNIEHFKLPDIGEGIEEAEIKEWKVKIGDRIKEFDEICEVASDKATATIGSRFDGVITRIYYKVGDKAKVGKPLIDIELDGPKPGAPEVESTKMPESLKFDSTSTSQTGDKSHKTSQISSDEPRLALLPSVRRLAKERGINLSKVKPTGREGRILKEDVLAHLSLSEAHNDHLPRKESQTPVSNTTKQNQSPNFYPSSTSGHKVSRIELETIMPLRGVRKAMFKTMTQSLKIPHFNYADEIDMTRLNEASARRHRRQEQLPDPGVKVSNLAFIIKLVSLALRKYPELNGSVDENGEYLVRKHYHNIGVAVDTKDGLVVPNVKNVQLLSVEEVNLELTRLRELGYASKLSVNDLTGATLTLSNIGAIGGIFGVPVLVSPEIVIGALGRTRKLPRYNSEGKLEERQIMHVVWSADHRVVDGATLSRFSNLLKLYLEEPEEAVLRLT